MAQYDYQTYDIYWDEVVTKVATVTAESAAQALELLREGEYDDIDVVEQDETGNGYEIYDESGKLVMNANFG